MIAHALPAPYHALAEHRAWIVWRAEHKPDGSITKTPCWSWNDPARQVSYEDAAASVTARGAGHSVGFVFNEGCGLFFLDLDACENITEAEALAGLLFPGALIERSVSGRGLHVVARYEGERPQHGTRGHVLGIACDHAELYTHGRWMALGDTASATGDAGTLLDAEFRGSLLPIFTAAAKDKASQKPPRVHPTSSTPPAPTASQQATVRKWLAERAALVAQTGEGGRNNTLNAQAFGMLAYVSGECITQEEWFDAFAAAGDACGLTADEIEKTLGSCLARPPGDWRQPGDGQLDAQGAGFGAGPLPIGASAQPLPIAPLDAESAIMLQTGTQDAVALIFAKQAAGSMLFNHRCGAWMEWDGTRWKVEQTGKAFDYARRLARQMNIEGKISMGSAAFCNGVEQFARADPSLAVDGSGFDSDNYLLNTPGGTFDLRTNTLRPHDPSDRITMIADATPSAEGGAVFLRFLQEITEGDAELAEFLQVSLGACLSGAVESHWLLFWTGSGRNGKNTLGDLVADAMGNYARKVPSSVLMAQAHEAHPTEIANLQGVRLAVSSEINDGEHWNEARINEVTGDATLSARFMRGDLFTFKRTHKHLIFGNHRPQLRTVGTAIRSRLKIVPFRASFAGREDADLPRRLRAELGYVMGWLIEGHRKWLDAGRRLPPCRAVDAESDDYFGAQSTVDMWLAERVRIVPNDERGVRELPTSGDLYRDYSDWKRQRGEQPVSQTRWAESMRGFVRVKSAGVRYRGARLVTPFDPPDG